MPHNFFQTVLKAFGANDDIKAFSCPWCFRSNGSSSLRGLRRNPRWFYAPPDHTLTGIFLDQKPVLHGALFKEKDQGCVEWLDHRIIPSDSCGDIQSTVGYSAVLFWAQRDHSDLHRYKARWTSRLAARYRAALQAVCQSLPCK